MQLHRLARVLIARITQIMAKDEDVDQNLDLYSRGYVSVGARKRLLRQHER